MADYPTSQVPLKLKNLLERLPSTGTPQKADVKWLKNLGYQAANDKSIARILQLIGFTDEKQVPTDRWKAYRGTNRASVLGIAIKECYAELFFTYPEAHNSPEKDLVHFFRSKTEGSDISVNRIVKTFKILSSIADFNEPDFPPEEKINSQKEFSHEAVATADPEITTHLGTRVSQGLTVNLNLQLTLPESTNAELLDQLFSAMSKHLLKHG